MGLNALSREMYGTQEGYDIFAGEKIRALIHVKQFCSRDEVVLSCYDRKYLFTGDGSVSYVHYIILIINRRCYCTL